MFNKVNKNLLCLKCRYIVLVVNVTVVVVEFAGLGVQDLIIQMLAHCLANAAT